jgi:hypothetical protein
VALGFRLAFSILLFVWTPRAAQAGALRDVESTAHRSDDEAESSDSSGSSWSSSDDSAGGARVVHEDSGTGSLFGDAMLHIVGFPWILPRLLVDDGCLTGYAEYPFREGVGLARSSACPERPRATRGVLWEAGLESGYMLEHVVPATAALRLQLPMRVELAARVSLLRDEATITAEHGLMGSAHVAYRFARSRRADFRTGIGVRLFVFDIVQAGVDLLYAVDTYLGRRAIGRVEFHLGTLGDALTGQARATLGVMVERFELYAGYDHTAVWGEGTARLGGPVLGFRGWF